MAASTMSGPGEVDDAMNMLRFWTLTLTSLGGLALAAGCGDEVEETPPVPIDETGGGGPGGANVGASGGGGGDVFTGRGDPANFPSSCTADCEAACERLAACDGDASVEFPLDEAECLTRCGIAQNGPIWDDVSGNFLCCTAQEACGAVQNCGGWLDHPAVQNACDRVCVCFFGAALEPLQQPHEPPPAYRFADTAFLFRVDATLDLSTFPALKLVRLVGDVAEIRFTDEATSDDILALARWGQVLPTFYDRAGRMSAATGTVIVDVPDAVAAAKLRETLRRGAFAPSRGVRWAPSLRVVDVADPWRALDLRTTLARRGLKAELDQIRRYTRRYVPSDPLFGDQWHLLNTGQSPSVTGVDARVADAWDLTQGDAAVIVSINDDGVDITHPDFAGRLEPELNFDSDWETALANGTYGNHGTSVAGVATAGIDDQGGAGACPNCRLLPHQLGPSDFGGFQLSDMDVAEGFTNQVEAGAAIINNSWGFSTGDPVFVSSALPIGAMPLIVSTSLDNAEQNGRGGLGTVVVFAAGNDNGPLDYYGTHPNVIAVGAIGDLGTKSFYSSFGPTVDVAAPSNGHLTGITTTQSGGGHTDSFGGTSSAAPLVSGVLGLVLSANPTLTAAEVRQIVTDSSTAIDPVYGAYDGATGLSPFYGAGMINAYHAVQLATGNCTVGAPCLAPSDDCGAGCGASAQCGGCRTGADCAPGFACQSLTSLGETVCVQELGTDPACPAGTTEVNGYCLPSPTTCGLCQATEACNGRDDDCDGAVDEDDVCEGPARCFVDGLGCAAGTVCAARQCVPECTTDDDCDQGAACEVLKDQYGASSPAVRGCVPSQASQCVIGCSVLSSSTEDDTLDGFVDCMDDGNASCQAAFGCLGDLPINF
ncbi:MAG: S8 family serine peptidase [Myxococcota bacterium]